MKKMFFFVMAVSALTIACKQPETTPAETTEAAATTEATPTPEFAYTIDHPADNWVPGKLENVATVLKSLKGYETGDMDACMSGFADSVKIEVDGFEAKMSNDSVRAMLASNRKAYKELKVVMSDWETVISKDKKTEFVSLWYKEIWTDQKGKVDSVEYMDDARMENGKIVSLNEKSRRFPAKK